VVPESTVRWRVLSLIFFLITSLTVYLGAGQTWADQATEARIHLLQEQINEQPQRQLLYIQQAIAYSDNQQADLALARLAIAEKLGPPTNAAFAHGIVLYRLGEFDGAKDYFSQHLEASPRHLGSLEYRARLLRDSGDFEGALRDFEALFRLNPTANPGHYLSVARMIAALPSGGQDRALAMLDERMEQVGVLSQLQRHAIEVERSRKNYGEAIRRLSTLDESLRATPQWKVEVAELSILNGRLDEARPLLDVAAQQLATLSVTGSRQALVEKINLARKQLDEAGTQ
jgi:tetratricopeptide (TPR) repeat protein